MFFVTAHMVKPVSPDDLPNMRGIDGLKGNSPLGVEPKGEGVEGKTGYKVSGQNEADSSSRAGEGRRAEDEEGRNDYVKPARAAQSSSVRNNNTALPVAKAVTMDSNPNTVRPW